MKLPNYTFNNPAAMCARFSNQTICNIINLKNSGKKNKGFAVYYSGGDEYCAIVNTFEEAQDKVNAIIVASDSKIERIHYIPNNF